MHNIVRLEALLTDAETVLREQQQQLEAKPDSFFWQGLVTSSRAHIEELTRELTVEKQHIVKEFADFDRQFPKV